MYYYMYVLLYNDEEDPRIFCNVLIISFIQSRLNFYNIVVLLILLLKYPYNYMMVVIHFKNFSIFIVDICTLKNCPVVKNQLPIPWSILSNYSNQHMALMNVFMFMNYCALYLIFVSFSWPVYCVYTSSHFITMSLESM